MPSNLYIKTIHYGVQKNSHTGFDSRTGPNWSFLGQDVKKKKSLILSPDAKNDFNHKSKYSKIFLPKGQYSQKCFNPKSKRPSQNILGLVFNMCGLGSYTGPKQIDF